MSTSQKALVPVLFSVAHLNVGLNGKIEGIVYSLDKHALCLVPLAGNVCG